MANLQFLMATLAAFPAGVNSYTRGKIIVQQSMITNESGLGNPMALFDQPEAYTEGGSSSIPTTEGWIPSFNAGAYPLSFYVDLGANYALDTAYIFDGNGSGSISISTGTPGAWTKQVTDPLANYELWNKKTFAATSRYVRVTYDVYNDAKGVREIVLYGTRQA